MNVWDMTLEERMETLLTAASTLTQEQVDACAWVMGCSGADWTPIKIVEDLKKGKVVLCPIIC